MVENVESAMRNLKAKDVMNPNVLVVTEDMTASELAAFLTDHEISGAPVVDDAGRLLGVVSLADLARSVSASGVARPDRSDPEYFVRGWEERFNPEDVQHLRIEADEVTVGDLMSAQVRTVDQETTVRECARKMLDNHLHRLLVTADGRLAGILSTLDLVRLLAGE